jgi:hypothetical protein
MAHRRVSSIDWWACGGRKGALTSVVKRMRSSVRSAALKALWKTGGHSDSGVAEGVGGTVGVGRGVAVGGGAAGWVGVQVGSGVRGSVVVAGVGREAGDEASRHVVRQKATSNRHQTAYFFIGSSPRSVGV